MAKPRSAPTASPFELPEAQPLTSFDPFALAKQFDQMRTGMAGGPAPFQMPVPQPKAIPFGGTLPGGAHSPDDGHGHGAPPRGASNAPRQPSAGWQAGASDWGSKTATFQAQFPSLRHTSGYRSPEHNARTPGASPTSYHMQRDQAGKARANDYVGSPKDMQAAAAWAKANGAKEVLVHNAGTGQHLHIAWLHGGGQSERNSDEALRGMPRHQRPGSVLPGQGLRRGPQTSVHHLL